MSDTGGAGSGPGQHSRYFFLSYAHSPPLEGYPEADPDQLVREFFVDLVAAVERHTSRRSGSMPGFFDQEIPVDSNWKEALSQALSAAEVFVPLYSPRYVAGAWPGREWACFRQRMETAGLPDPEQRFLPVLWTPLPDAQDPPGLREALALGPDDPDYAENGLRALLKIRPYRESYEAVVSQLAERIVRVADESPLEPSAVPDIDKVESEFRPKAQLAVFAVKVAAPTTRTVASDHDPSGYGASSPDWRPFPQQELPLAEYAKQVVERFDFKVHVSGIEAVGDKDTRRPGIILIDPWFIDDREGRLVLESAVSQLPRWVLPLVVSDELSDGRTAELAEQVRAMLSAAGALHTEWSRRAARGVHSLDDFVSIMPELVGEAERQYLRHGSGRVRPRPSKGRPRLGATAQPDAPSSAPDRSPGEALDG
jgi:FxsC-like protein